MLLLSFGRFVRTTDQLLHRVATVARPTQHIQQHAVVDAEARGESLGRRIYEADESIFIPVNKILFGRLAIDGFLSIARCFFLELQILDNMFRRLDQHPSLIIETLTSGPSPDLMKLARAQDSGFLPIVFAQLAEEHGA